MPLDDHSEALCFDCESGKYMPTEGAAECHNCSVPICAKELTYCDPIHGGAQQYVYYSTAEANALECLAADPYDACDLPQYCRDDSAQCRLWPDNRHTMVYRMFGMSMWHVTRRRARQQALRSRGWYLTKVNILAKIFWPK